LFSASLEASEPWNKLLSQASLAAMTMIEGFRQSQAANTACFPHAVGARSVTNDADGAIASLSSRITTLTSNIKSFPQPVPSTPAVERTEGDGPLPVSFGDAPPLPVFNEPELIDLRGKDLGIPKEQTA
jgi:hypothetical protein